jgi:capsular exopolysaccharide synthesis family protein
MNPEPQPIDPNRATVAAQFFNRLHRGLNILRSRWWVLLLGIGLALGFELYQLRKTPPSYFSLGRMIVSARMSVPNASGYTEEWNNFLGTQVGLLQSDVVSNRALLRLRTEKPGLTPSPISLDVTVSPKTSIFNLRALSDNPDYAEAFLQGVMVEYVALKKEMLRDASDMAKTGLQQVLAQLGTDLDHTKGELIKYGATNREVYVQEQGNSAADYLANLTRNLADLKSELQLLKTLTLDENVERLIGLQQSFGQQSITTQGAGQQGQGANGFTEPPLTQSSVGLSQPSQFGTIGAPSSGLTMPGQLGVGSTTTPAQMGSSSPQRIIQSVPPTANSSQVPDQSSALVGSEEDYLKAKQMILLMKAQRDDLGKYLRPKHPKIIALNDEIDKMEKLLEIFRGQTKDQLKDRQHTLEVQIENMEKDIKVWEVKTVEISKKMADYQDIKDRIQRLQNISDSLFASESTVDLTTQISPDSVSILEPATPGTLAAPPTVQRASIAAIVGLAAAVALLLFLDRLDDRPNSYTELQDLFDETVLGQIPRVRAKDKKAGTPFIQPEDDRHAFVEAYRNLRSSLIFLDSPKEHPKILLVTSAIPGDGKSMTTANLAITIARSGARVLLVDADLRRGMLHKRFDIESTPGLTEVLEEQCPWTKAVTQNSVPNLDIIPRGAVPKHPGELFMKSVREGFLKEAGTKYDFILIDTPPIMAADDVSNLAPHVDGVLMVIRANWTSGRVARAALDLLYTRKATVLGIVFNGVKSTGGDYYYYKYKEYYNKSSAA